MTQIKIDSSTPFKDLINNMTPEGGFPIITYFVNVFGICPFVDKYFMVDIIKLIEYLIKSDYTLLYQFKIAHDELSNYGENEIEIHGIKIRRDNHLIFKNDNLLIQINAFSQYSKNIPRINKNGDIIESVLGDVNIYKNSPYDDNTKFMEDMVITTKKISNIVYYISQDDRGKLILKNSTINPMDIDIELLYGKELAEKHNKITESISDLSKSGINLFYGPTGTGKSSYIRHLISCIKNRKVIIASPNMINDLSSPQFIPFMLDNPNSLLIVEEAENIIRTREAGSNPAISNLLNIGDGLLGDSLNMQIICSFNTEKDKIDTALLRKGRLNNDHYFDKLSIEDAQRVLDTNNIEYTAKDEMTLAEIFNTNEIDFSDKIKKQTKTIGFRKQD